LNFVKAICVQHFLFSNFRISEIFKLPLFNLIAEIAVLVDQLKTHARFNAPPKINIKIQLGSICKTIVKQNMDKYDGKSTNHDKESCANHLSFLELLFGEENSEKDI